MKRKNLKLGYKQYTALLESTRAYIVKIKNRKDIPSFYYGVDKIKAKELYSIDDLYYKQQPQVSLGMILF